MEINDLRNVVRCRLDDGDFARLYLWTKFWANGGRAGRAELDAFIDGRQKLSDNDAVVLTSVLEELRQK